MLLSIGVLLSRLKMMWILISFDLLFSLDFLTRNVCLGHLRIGPVFLILSFLEEDFLLKKFVFLFLMEYSRFDQLKGPQKKKASEERDDTKIKTPYKKK